MNTAPNEPHEPPEPPSFADWLHERLAANGGESQEAFARRCGVSLGTVNRWLRGVSEPSYGQLWRVVNVLGECPFTPRERSNAASR